MQEPGAKMYRYYKTEGKDEFVFIEKCVFTLPCGPLLIMYSQIRQSRGVRRTCSVQPRPSLGDEVSCCRHFHGDL